MNATWREAQGHDCAVRALCLQVVSVQLLRCCKGALGRSCLTKSLHSDHDRRKSACCLSPHTVGSTSVLLQQ